MQNIKESSQGQNLRQNEFVVAVCYKSCFLSGFLWKINWQLSMQFSPAFRKKV